MLAVDPPKMESATDPDRSFRAVLDRLAHAQKSSKGSPAYSRFVNRRAGRILAAVAYRMGLTPNTVTALGAILTFLAIALVAIAAPSWQMGLTVSLLLATAYALDAADGQLARLRGGGTLSGEWLDHMLDATKLSSLHLAVLVMFYRFFELPSAAWLLVPLGFAIVAAVMFFGMTLNDQLRRLNSSRGVVSNRTQHTSLVRSLFVVPTDYGLICWIFVLLAAPSVFFWVYTAIFVGNAAFMALAAIKWFKDMKALDESAARGSG